MKIAIIGYSGSGKSTFAKKVSEVYDIPVLYLDTLHWLPNWKEIEKEEEIKKTLDFLNNNEEWVIDGNYFFNNIDERLNRADKIVFFNFNRFVCLKRAYKRYHTYKNKTRDSMTVGCPEKMDASFIHWILHEGRIKKRKDFYKATIKKYPNKIIVVKNQKQLDALYVKVNQKQL